VLYDDECTLFYVLSCCW